jgi:drug/metabolite transporter (DMT)-like permease
MSTSNVTSLGIVCALGASLFFSLNDMSVKFLSGDYALHQIVLTRSIFGLILTLAIIVPLEGGFANLKTKRIKLHLLRGMCVVFANMVFFLSLASLPFADATAVFFIAPLIITGFAVLFLGEKVGLRRWLAVGVGLIGVIVILKPGSDSMRWIALMPAAAAIAYAALHTLTRKIGVAEKASTMSFYIQVTFIVVSGTIGIGLGDGRFHGTGDPSLDFLFRAWVIPTRFDFLVMVAIGIGSAGGGYLISQAYRIAEAGKIAPFEYVAMPLAIMWGVLIWNEWPDMYTWIGITLIVGAGLYVFWREALQGGLIARRRSFNRNR